MKLNRWEILLLNRASKHYPRLIRYDAKEERICSKEFMTLTKQQTLDVLRNALQLFGEGFGKPGTYKAALCLHLR